MFGLVWKRALGLVSVVCGDLPCGFWIALQPFKPEGFIEKSCVGCRSKP